MPTRGWHQTCAEEYTRTEPKSNTVLRDGSAVGSPTSEFIHIPPPPDPNTCLKIWSTVSSAPDPPPPGSGSVWLCLNAAAAAPPATPPPLPPLTKLEGDIDCIIKREHEKLIGVQRLRCTEPTCDATGGEGA
jgi:hypothetical protein